MAYFPFEPVSYAAPERERFSYSPFASPAPSFVAPDAGGGLSPLAMALIQAGGGVLSADPRKGFAGALGSGISGGMQGFFGAKKHNSDEYDKKYRRAREEFGDERDTWKLGREDHNTGQRFAADDVRDSNRFASEDAGRKFEADKTNSRGIFDAKVQGDQSARGWANHGLSKERLSYDRTKDARDFEERRTQNEREFGLRVDANSRASQADQRAAAADRRAEEAAALARQQPEIKVNAWGEGVVIPRNEQGVFDVGAIRHIGNPNGGRPAAGSGAGAGGTKVTLDKVSEKDLLTLEAGFADSLGLADTDADGYSKPTSDYRSQLPPAVRQKFRDAAALELARTGNIQAAIRAGASATGIPEGSRLGGGFLGFGQSLQGPDGKALGLGTPPPGVAPPAPSRTQIVPRGAAPMPQAAPAPAPASTPMPAPETVGAPAGQKAAPVAPSQGGIPPVEQRVVGQKYTTPNGREAVWTLNGWQLAK